MKKKTLAVVLSAVLAMGSAGTVFADTQSDLQAVDFTKAQTDQERYLPPAWAKEIIYLAIAKGAVPKEICVDYQTPITRAEFCKAIIMGIQSVYGELEVTETDVPYLHYLYDASEVEFADCDDSFVILAARAGIVSGDTNGNFHPNDSLTREQVAAILVRTMKSLGVTGTVGTTRTFSDIGQASSYAVKDIQQIAACKVNGVSVMSGMNKNEFAPKGTFTRAQAIVAIQRLMNYMQSIQTSAEPLQPVIQDGIDNYLGEWYITDRGMPEIGEYGETIHSGTSLRIYKEDDQYKLDMNALYSSTAFVGVSGLILSVNGNMATTSYDEDGWDNSGDITLEFANGELYVTATAIPMSDSYYGAYNLKADHMHCTKQWEQAYAGPLGEYAGEYEVGDFFVGLHPSSTGEYTLNVQKNRYKEDGTWDILDFANSEVLQINGNRAVAFYTDDHGNRGEMIFEFGDTCWITVTVTDQQSEETLEMARTQISMSADVG